MQVVALVAATLHTEPKVNMKRPPGIRYTGETLIICPTSLTEQWAEEFSSSSNDISVLVSI